MNEDPSIRPGHLSVVRGALKPAGGLAPAGSGGNSLAMMRGDDPARRASTVPNIWRIAHNALRGRYLLVLGLGVLSALALGAVAWRLTPPPTFASEGLVRIAYSLPQVRVATDQNEPLPMFETFMQSQKTLITSRRAIEIAIRDPIWAANALKVPADPYIYYAKHLTVENRPKTELISFKVADRDALTAATAVTAIINAYSELYNMQDKNLDKQRLSLLEGQQRDLNKRINDLSEKLRAKAEPYGTTQLDDRFKELQAQRARREGALNEIQITMAETPGPAAAQPSAPARLSTAKPEELTTEQIVALDPRVSTYWEQQTRMQARVDELSRVGYGRNHPMMAAALRGLEEAQARTEKYADEYRKAHAPGAAPTYEQRAVAGAAGRSVDDLKANEANLRKLLDDTNKQLNAVGNARMEMGAMETSLTSMRLERDGVTQRIQDLQSEGALGGRLSVISKGEVELKPSDDNRWKTAGLGGFAGFFLPAIGAVMISLTRRRYRFSDEAANDLVVSRLPALGMLPNVPATGSTQPLRVAAAYAAHHLRVLLSSRATTVVKRTFLVTSAGDGEGKTTVTMALAISFAAAKHRTLVIDADFVGRRLTRGFNAQDQDGLYESMGHGDMDGQWLNAASNLCILPTGKAEAADACGVTAENVRLLLEQAIQHFDVVLIDTGSILGSPESAVLAREVDGVIVTISRGQQQGQVRRAILRLEALGAMVVGTVFNRADLKDFQSSYCTPTSGWGEPDRQAPVEETELQQRVANFGPLVRAVAAAVPTESHAEDARV